GGGGERVKKEGFWGGFKNATPKRDYPMAVGQVLGALADQRDDTKSRLEDMMRELSHRHTLATQPHKVFQSSN
ncbi:hypothetical protein KCA24_34850, partial [Escherichia coli]|nr:hypothetical protein [Escherichia coli]